ncbi:hypothetical protein [Metabacillus sp. RGM 3146]|uniref:hypothetical protein n=1 Tax=Metabacillus sp. RGM 3146 TaxID=3401092 RepID=UPI003B9C0F1E
MVKIYGSPIRLTETRTAAVCKNESGEERLVIAAKGFILIVNPSTGISKQLFFPGKPDYPYVSFSSKSGLFYTGYNRTFLAADPFKEKILFAKSPIKEDAAVFSICENREGYLFFCTYPRLYLIRFDPKKQRFKKYGRIDTAAKYAGSMAADESGWIYIGIGTEAGLVTAFHPETKEKRTWHPYPKKKRGTGYVMKGTDGKVYGQMASSQLRHSSSGEEWYTFSGGQAMPVKEEDVPPSNYWGKGFFSCHGQLSEKENIHSFDLVKKEVTTSALKIDLEYEAAGAELSTLSLGPDRKIYGTSMHPMQFFSFDPEKLEFENLGPLEKGEGGNICAYATAGSKLIGAAYTSGKIYVLDTNKKTEPLINPKLIGSAELVHRPRCMAAHPDQEHIYFAGFPGYGKRGGGLAKLNVYSNKLEVFPNEQLIPNQSIVSFDFLSNGDVIGGTSVHTPGGAAQTERHACLFRLNWKNSRFHAETVPFQAEEEISGIIAEESKIYGLTGSSKFFLFSPEKLVPEKIISLKKYGKPARNGFLKMNGSILCLLKKAVIKIDLKTLSYKVIPVSQPITSGGAIWQNNLYFASGSVFCSLNLEEGGGK